MEVNVGVVDKVKIVVFMGLSSDLSWNEVMVSGCDLFLMKLVKMNVVREVLNELNNDSVGG